MKRKQNRLFRPPMIGKKQRLRFVIGPDMEMAWLTREERKALSDHGQEVMNQQYEEDAAEKAVFEKFESELEAAARAEIKELLKDPDTINDKWPTEEFAYLLHIAGGSPPDSCHTWTGGDMNEFRLAHTLSVEIPKELEPEAIGLINPIDFPNAFEDVTKGMKALLDHFGLTIKEEE